MEQKTETLKPSDLANLYTDEFKRLNSESLNEIILLEKECVRQIETFKEREEANLEYNKKIAKENATKRYKLVIGTFLKKFLAIIEPLEQKTRFSKEDDELLIDVLNSYEKMHGYLLGFVASDFFIIERKLTIIYDLNINRWRRKFGANKKIAKTMSNFFASNSSLFSSLSKKSVKTIEESYRLFLFNKVNEFRGSDKILNESFIWVKNAQMQKNQMVIEKRYEKAAELRDSENSMRKKIFEKLKELLPDTVADTDIFSVIGQHIK